MKYECDRCHQQFTDKKDMAEIRYEVNYGSFGVMSVTYHYCTKCLIYYNNAVHNVNNGTFDGVVKE